jgi:hypothetical protein
MKQSFLRLGFAALMVFAVAAGADVIQITGVGDGTTKNFTVITNPALPMSGPTFVNATAYTGLYDATYNGTQWKTFCIDPVGDIQVGNSWNANLLTETQLSTGTQGVLSATSYTTTNAVAITPAITAEKYAMIGYLADNYYYNLDPSKSDRSDLSLAFWEIARDYTGDRASMDLTAGNFMSNTSISDKNFVSNLLDAAFANKGNSYSLAVFSPTTRPSQEFLAFRVPEPALIGMLLTGLCALGGLGIARRRKVM